MRVSLGIDVKNVLLNEKNESLKKLKIGLYKKNYLFRWVPIEEQCLNLISTEIESEKLHLLDHHLRDLTTFPNIILKLQGITALPNKNSARVLAIGVQKTSGLVQLQQEVLHKFTLSETKPIVENFRPHINFLRFRNHRNVSDLISPYRNFDFGLFKVDRLILSELVLRGAFPVNRSIKIYHLNLGSEVSLEL
ncbi:MAG: hypothetical protein AB7I27_14815 [Bacteriovoracaceae bacterium]